MRVRNKGKPKRPELGLQGDEWQAKQQGKPKLFHTESFIAFFLCVMVAWMGVNIYFLKRPFDPYPFILLNLVLSTIAALQAPLIMMSQNRKDEKDRERAINDYIVNLKAEIEVRNLHQKLDLLISEQMQTLFKVQKMQMDLMEEIREEMPGKRAI